MPEHKKNEPRRSRRPTGLSAIALAGHRPFHEGGEYGALLMVFYGETAVL
jgi:hypothetical protein